MGKGYRPGRLGEEIRRIVSDMLLRELKDPRFSKAMVSVTDVDVSSDSSYATLYLTAFGLGADSDLSEEERADILNAFFSARGKIRAEIGRKVKLRHIPELTFKFDTSLEYGRHMDEVLSKLEISGDGDSEKAEDKGEHEE